MNALRPFWRYFGGKWAAVQSGWYPAPRYNAPDCADKTAAIRCVRLARNAANEFVTTMNGDGVLEEMASLLIQTAMQESMKARWQANSAIACEGK